MSSTRVFLGELLSSRARFRFSGYAASLQQQLPLLAKEIPANGTQGLLSLSHSKGSLGVNQSSPDSTSNLFAELSE